MPDRFGVDPIIGWRSWRVLKDEGRLGPLWQPDTGQWAPGGRCVARCRDGRAAPCSVGEFLGGRWHVCGFFAWKTREEMESAFAMYDPRAFVVGMVSLWGSVIEHTRGYRAMYAYPYQLWATDASNAGWISRAYGVECGVFRPPGRRGLKAGVRGLLGRG